MITEIENTFFKSENLCSKYNFLELFLISEVIQFYCMQIRIFGISIVITIVNTVNNKYLLYYFSFFLF